MDAFRARSGRVLHRVVKGVEDETQPMSENWWLSRRSVHLLGLDMPPGHRGAPPISQPIENHNFSAKSSIWSMDMLPSAFIPLECWGWDIDAGGFLVNLNEPGQGGTSGKRGANDAVAIRDLPTAAYAFSCK